MNSSIEFTTASAGSGKTFRLVDIVSKAIIGETAKPQGIVATTFTVAAANELRERLAAKLYEEGRHDDAVLLGAGMIGTVHGICFELLSRFAIQAGVSPEVAILDDTQSQILLSRAFDAILTSEDETDLQELTSRLSQTDNMTGAQKFRSVIPDIVSNSRSNDIDPKKLPAIGTASWEEMKAELPDVTTDDLDKELQLAIKGALRELDPNSTVGTIQTYRHLLHDCERSIKSGKLTWADWNKLSTAAPGTAAANAHISAPVQEIASRLGEHPGFHKDLESYLFLLFNIASKLAEEFGKLKRESGSADFADLEKETLDLLTHSEEVRSILTEEIDLLVVDEFQDTSPIQLALFSRLAECAKRVVWVGDVKQAIYGFRGADPDLIINAVAGTEKTGTLGESWRSVPDLVHFVNELFAKPFEDHLDLPREEVALTPHRKTHPDAPPALRIANVTSGEIQKNGKVKALKKEFRHSATADAIHTFLNSNEQVIDKASVKDSNPGTLRPVTPRDIAVLVRTGDNAIALADELRARGIDVSLSTAGLIAAPECQLALACLRVLIDPRDSLACAEVIALEGLYQPEDWLKDRLAHLQKRSEATPGETIPAWGTDGHVSSNSLNALISKRTSQNLDTLSPLALYDIANDAADVPRLVSAWGPTQQRAEQRLANLSRLREFIAEYQSTAHGTGSPVSLNGLFGWITDLADDYGSKKARDKCPVDPEIDAVHIGTYHGAKGLEWPVVFATDLDTDTRSRLFSLRTHSETETFDLTKPLVGRSLRLWINPFGRSNSTLIDALEASPTGQHCQSSALSEDLRLLYVGLTRARDTLVLVHDPATSPSWFEITNQGDVLKTADETVSLGNSVIPIASSFHVYEPLTRSPEPAAAIQVPVRSEIQTERQPLLITASARKPIPEAAVAETIEFGTAIEIPATIIARDYGDAMHRILAAEIQNPSHPAREQRALRLLAHWKLEQLLTAEQLLKISDTYQDWIKTKFNPTAQFIEVPFSHSTANGQQVNGFIDHLILTDKGPVIIDHKIFPGPKSKWEETALSYSGQLSLYQQVVSAAYPDQPTAETWLHLVSAGAALRVG